MYADAFLEIRLHIFLFVTWERENKNCVAINKNLNLRNVYNIKILIIKTII